MTESFWLGYFPYIYVENSVYFLLLQHQFLKLSQPATETSQEKSQMGFKFGEAGEYNDMYLFLLDLLSDSEKEAGEPAQGNLWPRLLGNIKQVCKRQGIEIWNN